jgi:hypothetical protein
MTAMTCQHTAHASDDRVGMTFGERNTWVYAVLVPVASLGYFAVVLSRLADQPAAQVAWVGPMLWTIAATTVGAIVGSIAAAIVSLDTKNESDVRDREIDRHGDRIAQAITGFGSAGVLALVMLKVDHFWIANALFAIGAVGATWGAVAKLRAYRGAFHSQP